MYSIYLNKIKLPIAPSSLTTEITNQNKTFNLVNGGQRNIIKKPGLSKIKFSVLLPHTLYPFVNKESQTIGTYLELFENIKTSQKAVSLKVLCDLQDGTRKYKINTKVTLESYTITESTDIGFDTKVDLTFLEYEKYGTQKRVYPKNKFALKTYTIKKGDTLKKIAKRKMGDDEYIKKNANEIWKLNKKVLTKSAKDAGKKPLHGLNLIKGTKIIIPFHVNTPDDIKASILQSQKKK